MSCTMQLLNICVYTKSYLKILAQLNISNILHHISLSCIHLCITIWWWCWTLKQWNICFWKIRKCYAYLLCPCIPILTEGLVDSCWIFLLFSFEFTLLNTLRLYKVDHNIKYVPYSPEIFIAYVYFTVMYFVRIFTL